MVSDSKNKYKLIYGVLVLSSRCIFSTQGHECLETLMNSGHDG